MLLRSALLRVLMESGCHGNQKQLHGLMDARIALQVLVTVIVQPALAMKP